MTKISEHLEQVAIFEWADLNVGQYPQLKNMFAIPNGGQREHRTGTMLKREGVKSGISDMCLCSARGGYFGLFIELKKRDGKLSEVSKNQKEWIDRLNKSGYLAKVAFGAKEAVEIIIEYLSMTETKIYID